MGKKILQKISSEAHKKLISGSAIIFAGSVVGYLLNYVYNLIMGRFLGPEDFGHLTSLISLLYLVTFPLGAISMIIVKFVTAFKSRGELGNVYSLFLNLTKKFSLIGVIFFVLLVMLENYLVSFLKLPDQVGLIIIGLMIVLTFFSSVVMSVLQGLLNFKFITFINSLTPIIKLVLALTFVYLGMKANGALLGILLAGVIGVLISLVPISKLRARRFEEVSIDWEEIKKFALPAFLSVFFFALMANIDILLVKHYFSETEAGLYSALSIISKVIFFIAGPVHLVLFPLLVENREKGEKVESVFWLAFFLIALASTSITILYTLNSQFWMKILFGERYLAGAGYLPVFGIFMSLYTLNSTFMNYFLTVNRVQIYKFTFVAALAQIVLIVLFHHSFTQVIGASAIVSGALLVFFAFYYKRTLELKS